MIDLAPLRATTVRVLSVAAQRFGAGLFARCSLVSVCRIDARPPQNAAPLSSRSAYA